MRGVAWLFALPWAAALAAATVQVDLPKGGHAELNLPVTVDDGHLAEPPGYFAPDAATPRVVRRITIENTGATPVANPDVRVNGQPLLPVEDFAARLGLAEIRDLPALFAAWRDRVVHATNDLEAGRDPATLLAAFGAAYCGDDARALAAITVARGGEVRFARLTGHSVAEHRLDESPWMLLDGDQNLLYLGWDNRTPVGEAEILADPLLALRTQVFGRQSGWQLDAASQNTARFGFVDAGRKPKPFRLKNAAPKRNWALRPGESLVIDLTRSPDHALAANRALQANNALRAAACIVEFHSRRAAGETIALPYPVLGDQPGEPLYEAKAGDLPVLLQAARAQFPVLHGGKNSIGSTDALRVRVDYESPSLVPVDPPVVRVALPHVAIDAEAADRMWWQISADADFRLVSPNLDRTSAWRPEITLSALDETFLSPGRHYARARVKRAGVWSDWSAPVPFEARKPARPEIIGMEGADGDRMHIRWKPARGEMLVFGSNRLDSLPEVYGDIEAVRLENGAIRESRPNKNLLAVVPAEAGEADVPLRASFRLIAREEGRLSLPSAPGRARMPALVLQNRHEKPDGALVGRDIAVETEVP